MSRRLVYSNKGPPTLLTHLFSASKSDSTCASSERRSNGGQPWGPFRACRYLCLRILARHGVPLLIDDSVFILLITVARLPRIVRFRAKKNNRKRMETRGRAWRAIGKTLRLNC